MEKIYKLLEWLTFPQAVDWLQDLTATQIDQHGLLQLCESNQCFTYIECSGAEGWGEGDEGVVSGTSDMQKVLNPKVLRRLGQSIDVSFRLLGKVWTSDPFSEFPERKEIAWEAKLPLLACTPYFKPGEIQLLAARMNEVVEPAVSLSASELFDQLNEERAAREIIEVELNELRRQRGSDVIGGIRHFLKSDADFDTIKDRAKKAESKVSDLEQVVSAQNEELARQADTIVEMAKRVGPPHSEMSTGEVFNSITCGLSFPYSTKALAAAREAVIAYWIDFDLDRPPLQKQVKAFMVERGVPERQAAELAIAIKPDSFPKA